MGNSESDLSKGAGSSEEESTRRWRENVAATAVAATAVATVVAAGYAVIKLASSSASEDDKTNDKGKMLVGSGSTSGGYQSPRIKFGDSPYDYYPENGQVVSGMGCNQSYPTPTKPSTIWHFPGCRKLKMNTDGSVIQDVAGSGGVGQAGFGLVIRDEGGNLIAGFYCRLKDCSIFEAELRGIHRGLETLQDHNLSKVEIESDSQAAVNQINSVKATSAKLPFVIKS